MIFTKVKKSLIKFKFVGFTKNYYRPHQEFGHVRIWKVNVTKEKFLKNANGELIKDVNGKKVINPEYLLEDFTYIQGKSKRKPIGGNNKGSVRYMVKDDVKGKHKYKVNYDKKLYDIKVVETKKLPNGDKVDIAEIRFWISELKTWSRPKTSTMWPKSWPIEKIERLTKEAAGNLQEFDREKGWGFSKDGIPIWIYIDDKGKIVNSFINTNEL